MKKCNVLVVDDDQIIRDQLLKELKRNFFTVHQAGCGREAMEIAGRADIDIILLDVKLPDIDGFELLEKLKQKRPDCVIIVITGFGNQEIAIQSLRRGAIDYIEKPIRMLEMSAALGRAQEKLAEKEELGFDNTILVIDDDKKVVESVKRLLEKEGYSACGASCGKEGLDIINQTKVDIIVSDIKMNDMNGIEVLRKAKKMYPDIEGIMITGYKDGKMAVEALRAGAIDYINKPIDIEELLLSVERAIKSIHLSRNKLYRNRELKISSEIISKMNEELERRIRERSKELSQTQAQLFQTAKLATLGEMSTGLAHEMNQPLGGIALIAENIRKLSDRGKLTEEELISSLDDIDQSVKRMSRVIQHIRTFARQDTLKFVEVEVNETISSAMSLLGEQLRLHEVEVKEELAAGIPKTIGEPYQLEQVWINLISNARDALDHKMELISEGSLRVKDKAKRLVISTAYDKKDNSIKVTFKDNGPGMAKETREKMFEPFYTTKEVGKSTGLGLSISYGIIESHKGAFEVESVEGEGTAVRVILPVREPDK